MVDYNRQHDLKVNPANTHTHTHTHNAYTHKHEHTQTHTHTSPGETNKQTVWEQSTDKKIQKNTVQRRVEGLLRQQRYSLEERRDKYATVLTCYTGAFSALHCA